MSEAKVVNVPLLVPADAKKMHDYVVQLDVELARVDASKGKVRTMVEKDFYRSMLVVLLTIFEPVRQELAEQTDEDADTSE